MRKLKKPEFTVKEVFELCNSRVENEDLKSRLDQCVPYIIQATNHYESLSISNQVHTFQDNLCTSISVTNKEMKKVYTDRMVGGPGRTYYDKIKNSSPSSTCPLCGQRKVSTVDHYLPKSQYPSLVVTPINLIPACGDCNKGKLHSVPSSSETITLHPYFDDLGNERFLFARIIIAKPPVIDFYIEPPSHWEELKGKRVKYHFDTFGLNELYKSHAPDEIIGQIEYWSELSPESLKDELGKQARSRIRKFPNSWQAALYECLSESEWFCKGGYLWFDFEEIENE
ncbi:HNH endonuclease [Brevibacillus porteri]|uniref:HNH endonuclease n=1 Tax=Brevibacillus porteri TaxID=2126350 RepID=UPI00370B19DC